MLRSHHTSRCHSHPSMQENVSVHRFGSPYSRNRQRAGSQNKNSGRRETQTQASVAWIPHMLHSFGEIWFTYGAFPAIKTQHSVKRLSIEGNSSQFKYSAEYIQATFKQTFQVKIFTFTRQRFENDIRFPLKQQKPWKTNDPACQATLALLAVL